MPGTDGLPCKQMSHQERNMLEAGFEPTTHDSIMATDNLATTPPPPETDNVVKLL